MMETTANWTFMNLLDTFLEGQRIFNASPVQSRYVPTIDDIPVSRVIYSGNTTTVYFIDGTKTTVTCSANDKYDRQTAIAYALVKRMFGKIGRTDKQGNFHANEIDGNGIGLKLEKIAASGYDQDAEKLHLKEKKATAKAEHQARQKAEHDAAWKKKVAKRAEEIRLEREASALADSLEKNGKKTLNESSEYDVFNTDVNIINAKPTSKKTTLTSGLVQIDPKDAWKLYRKPDKPFSKFTTQEKRDYWKWQNAKRRAANKK